MEKSEDPRTQAALKSIGRHITLKQPSGTFWLVVMYTTMLGMIVLSSHLIIIPFWTKHREIKTLTRKLTHDSRIVRQEIRRQLVEFGPDAIPELIVATKNDFDYVRFEAAETLGEFGPEARAAVPALILLLEDKMIAPRRSAAKALGRIGQRAKSAIPSLEECLEDPDIGPEAKKALMKIVGSEVESQEASGQHAIVDVNTQFQEPHD